MIQNMPKASIPIPVGGMYQEWSCLMNLVEEEPEHNDKYVTLVCITSESYDDKNDNTISEKSVYLRDNCPYGWGTLVKSDAKYMVIEKPKKQ